MRLDQIISVIKRNFWKYFGPISTTIAAIAFFFYLMDSFFLSKGWVSTTFGLCGLALSAALASLLWEEFTNN